VIRLLIATAIRLLANAVGLMVAAYVLEDMTISGTAFLTAVVIFTIVEVLIDPLLTRVALTQVHALRGSVALLTTFVGLIVTAWISDGLSIKGASTWLFATIIVWVAALIAGLILPIFMVKKAVNNNQSSGRA
jgi:putative membrane protein